MIIISDNSALSTLAEAGLINLLHQLFGIIVIPESVRQEACHRSAPAELHQWITAPPDWLFIVNDPTQLLPETTGLGSGEAAAITLASQDPGNTRLILDERRGRTVALALGLLVTGTIGIIGESARVGFVDFEEAIARLRATGFHVSDAIVEAVRETLGLD